MRTKPLLCITTIFILANLIAKEKPGSGKWSQFRGPNGSGLSETTGLPTEFGPDKNVIWKTSLPAGHSSPVLTESNIFLTAFEDAKLLTICLNRSTGEIIWRKEAPRPREEKVDYRNTPASASPVTDGKLVYVFFQDFGLLAYDSEGNEHWRHPLGPFNNVYGMGASPVLVDDKLILVCDQSTNSFIIALNKNSGKTVWKKERPEAKSGHSTPVIYETDAGQKQVVVPGSFLLTSYAVDTGEKVWWVKGLSFEMKSTPVMQNGVLYINGYGSPLNQPENQVQIPSFAEALTQHDVDKSGTLTKDELPDGTPKSWFGFTDLESDGNLNAGDWDYMQAALASLNGMLAIRLGGKGDMTANSIVWQYRRAVPQLPSPLLYKDVLYMINDGGIATTFKPKSGEVIKQGRIEGALDKYYASPVAADNKVFMVSRLGKASVLDQKGNLDVLAVNDLGEQCYATPAIADGRLFIRTQKTLYCFGTEK